VAVKEVRVSDLTGEQDDNMARLVVVSHPKFSGPITLDVREEEVRGLESLGDLVELEYTRPKGAPVSSSCQPRTSGGWPTTWTPS
jgi:hypothetical protein